MFLVPVSRESRQLARLFDETFDRVFSASVAVEQSPARSPALDVAESESTYTVKLEVPGVSKEDVKVSVEGRRVTVRAKTEQAVQAPVDQAAEDTTAKVEADRIVYRERAAVSYSRTFTLPVEVEQAEAGAKLEHGVLTLTLPKRNVRAAAQITIN